MFGYNAQFKRCTINGAKTLRVQRLSATTGVNTVMTNFKQSISSPTYKKGAIMTNLHREFDASSSQDNFLETLGNLKEIYSRNSYPSALVSSKIYIFLANNEKPERKTDEPYNCPRISIASHRA